MSPGPDPLSSPHPVSSVPGKTPVNGGRDSGSQHVGIPAYITANPRNSMSITNTKGLLNMPGQNNCFLNSAVQVLWHLDIFRRSFRELNGHTCMAESCIFCALKELFAQFQYSQESALPPDALRRALAETFCDQRRFQLGFMDDAAECFENILLRIHFHIANKESEDMCSANHCIPHQKFAMTLVEQTVCHACGATSEPLPFTQMVHYVPSSALCSQAKLLISENGELPGFGELLKKAGGLGDMRDCPSSCGAVIQIRKTLMNKPEIVSIGLVWDSERPTIDHIMDVFSAIGMTLKLQDVFHSVVDSRWASTASHQLVGIVTYYGKHYSTFFFHTKLRVWIYFDDAAVREIGPKWEQVVEKCYRGHFQPLLLLYTNPCGASVSTSTAPNDVTLLSAHKKSLSCKDVCVNPSNSNSKSAESIWKNHQSSENQRRALTPNPDSSCDINANILPRRAVTPNGEMVNNPEFNKKAVIRNKSYDNYQENTSASLPMKFLSTKCNKDSEHVYNVSSYLAYKQQLWENKYLNKTLDVPEKKLTDCKAAFIGNQCWPVVSRAALRKCSTSSDSSIITEKVKEPQRTLQLNPNSNALYNTSSPHGYRFSGQRNSDLSTQNAMYEDDRSSEKSYIDRKTVENVLHLQKLQKQKSMSMRHGHICLGQRNSNSSLESFENVMHDKGIDFCLKFEIPDLLNGQRKRDSGNWSGDRNSASSSSTTSLDNPYYYNTINKRFYCNGKGTRTSVPDSIASTDLGYDSFSLSSSDSYASNVFIQGKVDARLGLILENQQTPFSVTSPPVQDARNNEENHSYGFKDECEKLCMEADVFLAKSVERENIGDISMAAFLSDSAAAKARAAMDVSYNSPHPHSLAKLKHSTCLIRSSNLHSKLKETVFLEQQKRESMHKFQHNFASSHESNANGNSKCTIQEKQSNIFGKECTRLNASHIYSGSYANPEKSKIEIYATLPKKGFGRKIGLMSFVEALANEDNGSEKSTKQKVADLVDSGQVCTSPSADNYCSKKTQNSSTSHNKNKSPDLDNEKGTNARKKSFSFTKSPNKDSDLSDSADTEHPQKNSLFRTYSGPSSHDRATVNETINENPVLMGHSPKKQHKIRRKLMGGFMRRKNRSLPDLREGQDQSNGLSRSFDDCTLIPTQIKSHEDSMRENKQSLDAHSKNSEVGITMKDGLSVKNIQNLNPVCLSAVRSSGANTPPPYKPPPPITGRETDLEIYHKRGNLHNKDSTVKTTVPSFRSNMQTSTSESDEYPVDKNLQHLHKNGHQTNSDTKRTNSGVTSPVPSVKCSINPQKYINSPELPKGNAVWLKELQLKQEELNQKRKLKLQKVGSETGSNNYSFTSTDQSNSSKGKNDFQENSFMSQHDPDATDISTSDGLVNQTKSKTLPPSCQQSEHLLGESDVPNSVKSLALKFENIIKPASDINLSGSDQSNFSDMVGPPLSHSVEPSDKSYHHPLLEAKRSSVLQQKQENSGTKLLVPSNKNVYMCSSHLTDEQLTNMLSISTNCSSYRTGYVRTLNSKEAPCTDIINLPHKTVTVCTEMRRPDKPPDYETALQRLELMRGDRKLLRQMDMNRISAMEPSELDKKKLRHSKKSVTFSDKVVLVACAGDEDNDFLPNPLLERVYKQQLTQKPSCDMSENDQYSQDSNSLNESTQCSLVVNSDSPKQVTDVGQVSCNLCHSKLVQLPNIYCPDCAFYMSRFQK